MDSRDHTIYKLFAVLMLHIYMLSATATYIDCNGKSFHCVNSTHFMICVDLGGGVSKTVNDFVIQCPATTVCSEHSNLECIYELPTTTQSNFRPGDEPKYFTTNTEINTTSVNEIKNTVSNPNKISVTELPDEYFNTIGTTYADNVTDLQTYTNEVSRIPKIINNRISTSYDPESNVLTTKTNTYSVENLLLNNPEMNNQYTQDFINLTLTSERLKLFPNNPTLSEQIILERSNGTNIAKSNEITTNPSNGISSLNKLMDILYDTTKETATKDKTTFMAQEVYTVRGIENQFTQTEISDMTTKYFPPIIATTQNTLQASRVEDGHNFGNTSPRIDVIITPELEQNNTKIYETTENYLTSNPTQDNNWTTTEENISQYNTFDNIDKFEFNSTTTKSKIELTTEANLIDKKEPTVLEVTDTYNFMNLSTTREPIIIPSKYLAEIKQYNIGTTESGISPNISMLAQESFTSTVESPISPENHVSVNVTSKTTINNIKKKLFNFDQISTNSTMPANEEGIEKQTLITEIISTTQTNDNTLTPNYDLLEKTSTIVTDNLYFDETTSATVYETTVPSTQLSQQNNKLLPSVEEHTSKVNVLSDIFATHTNIPYLLENTRFNLTNDYWTPSSLFDTVDPGTKFVKNVTGRNDKKKLQNVDVSQLISEFSSQKFSSKVNSISLSPLSTSSLSYVSSTNNISEREMETSAHDNNYNNVMRTASLLNVKLQSEQGMITETYQNTTHEYKKLFSKEDVLQKVSSITENPYSYVTSFNIENSDLKTELSLEHKIIGDNNAYTLLPYGQSEVSVPEYIFAQNLKTRNLALVSNYDQTNITEQVTDKKNALESTTKPYHNTEPYKFLSSYENATEISPQRAIVKDTENLITNEVAPMFEDANSTLTVFQDSNFLMNKENKKVKLLNYKHVVGNIKANESNKIKPELGPISTYNGRSEIVIVQKELSNTLTNNDVNLNTTSLSQDGNDTLIDWENVGFTSTENPMTPKNNILDINRVTKELGPDNSNFVKNTTNVVIENQDSFSDMEYKPRDKNIQAIEKSGRKQYNFITTDEYVLNDMPTSKTLTTDLVSKVDEILPMYDQFTTGVFMKNYPNTESPKNMIINTANNMFKKDVLSGTNTINESIINKRNHQDFASNKPLYNLHNDKLIQEVTVDTPLLPNMNLNKTPIGIVDIYHSNHSITENTKSINIINNFRNKTSNVVSVNFPIKIINDNASLKHDYDSIIIPNRPILYNTSNLLNTIENKNVTTEPNLLTKNGKLNDHGISKKSSLFVTTEIPTYIRNSVIDKSNLAMVETPFKSKVSLEFLNHNNTNEIQSIATAQNNTYVDIKANKRSTTTIICNHRSRGRFADKNNCRKYYICFGNNKPLFGECPNNTVFSEIKKQCTKNLSHCIRHSQFQCSQDGRFSDVLRSNIYYICVNKNDTYVRFQFQCQNGFHLNKTSVRCVKDIKFQSEMTSMSIDSNSNKGSDPSSLERNSKEKQITKENVKYVCKKEGKIPDEEDCRRYYVCTKNSKSVLRRRTKKCDSDEVFHREKKKCVDRDSYECNE